MSRWCEKKHIYIYTYNKSWHCGCVISSGSDSLLRGGRGALSRAILSHTALSHTQRCDTQTRTQTHTTLSHTALSDTHTHAHLSSYTEHCHTQTHATLSHTHTHAAQLHTTDVIHSLSIPVLHTIPIHLPPLPSFVLPFSPVRLLLEEVDYPVFKKNAILCITCIVVCMFLPKCRGASITCIASYMTISFK